MLDSPRCQQEKPSFRLYAS
uniref:Uncharacterized protein n=2 Tax=gambiae species complex TaxID=44542 RepID=A0A1S4H7P4_ANOGA